MNLAQLFVLFGVRLDSSWVAAGRALDSLKQSALAVSAVRWAARIVEGAAEAGTHLISLSNSMGLTVEQTQEWGNIAEKSGSNVNQLAVGLGMFDRQLRTFASGGGGKQLARAMNEIGLSSDDAKKALASPDGLDGALLKIADKFKGMGNDAERAALGQKLFGARGGRAMIADLSRGSEAIREMRQHFRDLGGEISTEQAGALRGLSNDINDVGVSMRGLANKAIATLAPILSALLHMASALAVILGEKLTAASKFLADHWAETSAVGVALIGTFLVLRAASIAAALASFGAWVMAALPIILLGALIGAVILVVNDLWVGFHGGRSVLMDLWEATKTWAATSDSTFASIIRGIEKVIGKFKEALDLMRQLNPAKTFGGITHTGDLRDADKRIEKAQDELKALADERQDRVDALMRRGVSYKNAVESVEGDMGPRRKAAAHRLATHEVERNDLADQYGSASGDRYGKETDEQVAARSAGLGSRIQITIGDLHVHAPAAAAADVSGFGDFVHKTVKAAIVDAAHKVVAVTPGGKGR